MLTAFEVAAIFKIKDEATKTLQNIARQVAELNKAIKDLAVTSDTVSKNVVTSFTRMTGGTTKAIEEAKLLSTEWIAITRNIEKAALAASRVGRVAGGGSYSGRPRIGGPGTAGGQGGLSFRPSGIPVPGVGHFHGGTAAMVGGGALGYSLYEETQLEDSVFQMAWHAGLPRTDENKKKFRDIIQKTASETGFGYHEIAEAATDEIRLLKGVPGLGPSAGVEILPEMLRAAATESRLKGTGLKESMRALVELAHMTKEYDPEQLKTLMPIFGFLSTANPATLPQMERAASYAMPTLQSALHMDPADVLYETTAIARAGATNSKSGTWVRSAFERALPPDPRFMTKRGYEAQMSALRDLGLVDAAGKSTVLDPTGDHIDIDKFLSTVHDRTAGMPLVDRNNVVKKVFGEQGARGVDLMMDPKVLEQNRELKREFPAFKNQYSTFTEDYSRESPLQKFRTTWMDLTNVLVDIGSVALPPVVKGLEALDAVLKGMTPGQQKSTVAGAAGGGVLGWFMGGPAGAAVGAGVGAKAASEASDNKMRGGFLGAIEDAYKLGGMALGFGKAKADTPENFDDRFGTWKSNFIAPPPKTEIQNHTTAVNIDGSQLAMIVEQRIAQNHELSDSASSSNGVAYANLNDWNPKDK